MYENPPLCMTNKVSEEVVETNLTEVIEPVRNNLHEYEALEDFAFLDLLVPDYDMRDRFCNFYTIVKEEKDRI